MKIRTYRPTLYKRYMNQGGCCFYCKEIIDYYKITRDHFKPKSKGYTGTNNIVFACTRCNGLKSNLTIYEFRIRLCQKLHTYLKKPTVMSSIKPDVNHVRIINKYATAIKTCTTLLKQGFQ